MFVIHLKIPFPLLILPVYIRRQLVCQENPDLKRSNINMLFSPRSKNAQAVPVIKCKTGHKAKPPAGADPAGGSFLFSLFHAEQNQAA
ncbi:MAG: hypothetical protein IJ233_05665, partial [Pyramidobacter sp.]|nr:hypothetical protein [Pyramidobacter sp.]